MGFLPAHKPPSFQLLAPIRLDQECLHLGRCSCSQARDVAVETETNRDKRDDVGEEQMQRLVVEEERGCESDERSEEKYGDEARYRTGLQLEDAEKTASAQSTSKNTQCSIEDMPRPRRRRTK